MNYVLEARWQTKKMINAPFSDPAVVQALGSFGYGIDPCCKSRSREYNIQES